MSELKASMDGMYEYLQAITQSEKFEVADEIMDRVPTPTRSYFAREVNRIAKSLGLSDRVQLIGQLKGVEKPYEKQHKQFLQTINRICEAVKEDPELLKKIIPQEFLGRQLDEKYGKYEEMANDFYNQEAGYSGVGEPMKISFDKKHEDFLENPNMLDDLVTFGDQIVKDFSDVWRAFFLAQASTIAPDICQGQITQRAQIHLMLIGEFSTAKSNFIRAIRQASPRVVFKTDITDIGLTGRQTQKGNEIEGIAKLADRSLLILDEFDKLLARHPNLDHFLRAIMTEGEIDRTTTYGTVYYQTKPVVVATANPKNDVFYSNDSLRDQIPFKEGLLSRFAYIKPLAYTTEKINALSEYMGKTMFKITTDERAMSLEDVKKIFSALIKACNGIERVEVSDKIMNELTTYFITKQEAIDGIPLLTTRDYMDVCRFLNASATLHVKQRQVINGVIKAQRDDLENALYLLDNTVCIRKSLLSGKSRREIAESPLDKAYNLLMKQFEIGRTNRMLQKDATKMIAESVGVKERSAYRYIEAIVKNNPNIKRIGHRNAVLEYHD